MIEIVRRLEYLHLQSVRGDMGKYVETKTVSCQHHDSNLINVELSRRLRFLDMTRSDPLDGNPPLDDILGNKSTESFSYNVVRFLASAFKKNKDWTSFMCADYGDTSGIPTIKSARFWAAIVAWGMHFHTWRDLL